MDFKTDNFKNLLHLFDSLIDIINNSGVESLSDDDINKLFDILVFMKKNESELLNIADILDEPWKIKNNEILH